MFRSSRPFIYLFLGLLLFPLCLLCVFTCVSLSSLCLLVMFSSCPSHHVILLPSKNQNQNQNLPPVSQKKEQRPVIISYLCCFIYFASFHPCHRDKENIYQLVFFLSFASRNAEYLAIASESKDNCAGVQVGE